MGTPATADPWDGQRRRLTDRVTVLEGADKGAYPSGNTVVVVGESETVVIDPSVTVAERGFDARVDLVLNSHAHEDHMAGNGLFASSRLHIHDDDLLAARSLDGLLEVYGLQGPARDEFAAQIETVAPGFGQRVVGRQVLTPADVAERFGLAGGCLSHVEPALDQLLYLRPMPELGRHDTPVEHFWLTGRGTHGGSTLTGLAGRNTALRILAAPGR